MTNKTIAAWASAGVVVRTGYGKFDLASSISGFAAHMRALASKRSDASTSTVANERARLLKVQADRAEMQLDQAYGRLVDADEISATVQKDLVAFKQGVLALPTRVAGRGGGLSQAALAIIAEEVNLVLDELADDVSPDDMPSAAEVARCMAVREAKGIARDLRAPDHHPTH